MSDVVRFAERIVVPCKPRAVVLYSGDNDLANGRSPERVFTEFKAFATLLEQRLPETRLLVIGVKPSIARWKLIDKARQTNRLIGEYAASRQRVKLVDLESELLGADGEPDPA